MMLLLYNPLVWEIARWLGIIVDDGAPIKVLV